MCWHKTAPDIDLMFSDVCPPTHGICSRVIVVQLEYVCMYMCVCICMRVIVVQLEYVCMYMCVCIRIMSYIVINPLKPQGECGAERGACTRAEVERGVPITDGFLLIVKDFDL